MTPPDNDRIVLTWASNKKGSGFWQLDSFNNGEWYEAKCWSHTVLEWYELPERRRLMKCVWEKDTQGCYILPLFGVSRIEGEWAIWVGWLYWLFTWQLTTVK